MRSGSGANDQAGSRGMRRQHHIEFLGAAVCLVGSRLQPSSENRVNRAIGFLELDDDFRAIGISLEVCAWNDSGEKANRVLRAIELKGELPRSIEQKRVTLGVYDASGRHVILVADETLPAGPHDLEWNAEGLAAGVYFIRLDAGRQSVSRKLLVVH